MRSEARSQSPDPTRREFAGSLAALIEIRFGRKPVPLGLTTGVKIVGKA
ncbi:MAG: hypothetical protein ACKO1M_01355 [Planctomycetota bacterium]